MSRGPGYKAYLFHPSLGNEVVEGRILVDRWGLRFQSGSVSDSIPSDRLAVEWEDSEGRVYFKDSTRPDLCIYTLDKSVSLRADLPQLAELRGEIAQITGRKNFSRSLRITLYALAVCVLAAWGVSLATSMMVRSLAAKVPPEWEEQFGRECIDHIGAKTSLVEHSNQVAQLTALAAPLLQVIPTGKTEVKFYIVDNPEPNAFAMPGGYVVVNSGLLKLTDKPEELLGVLAHELAHVTQRHLVRKMISASGPILIFGFFLHSRDRLLNTLSLGSGLMVFEGFSKEFETEADDVGWQYLVSANIDPRGMIRVFQKLKAWEASHRGYGMALPQAFNSHPLLEKRIARLESKWKRLPRQSGFLVLTNLVPSMSETGPFH